MNIKSFSNLKTLIFDCDGVILNSNKLKTEAFRSVALNFGNDAADSLESYHLANGGMSRYHKFDYFLKEIIPKHNNQCKVLSEKCIDIENLLDEFANLIQVGLQACEISSGLKELRCALPNTRWMIVSGSDQQELRRLLNDRGISDFFEAGIFGSPDTKNAIFERELKSNHITKPALYFGDSFYDFWAANQYGIDFIYVYGWSEIHNWKEFVLENRITAVESILELTKTLSKLK